MLERGGRSRRLRLDQWSRSPRAARGCATAARTVLGEDGRTPSLEIHRELARQRKWR
ncbi:MAG: hypothetical protein R3F30_05395 [Planctomycetota bacterium]